MIKIYFFGGVGWLDKLEIKPTQPQLQLGLKLGLSLANIILIMIIIMTFCFFLVFTGLSRLSFYQEAYIKQVNPPLIQNEVILPSLI